MHVTTAMPRPKSDKHTAVARQGTCFRDPSAAEAGGYVLAVAGVLVALGLVFHPLPAGGFEEQPGLLASTPLWGAVHMAIALGFVGCVLGGLLVLVAGSMRGEALASPWIVPFCWGALTVGMIFFTGVALINAWVLHVLAPLAARGEDRLVFDAFNKLLVGYGWLGNPLFLVGLTGVAAIEVRHGLLALPRWLAVVGLTVAVLSWLRGIGSATGLYALEPFVLANIPAFLWLGGYGLRIAWWARRQQQPLA
jgi:hypothetical protein